jgi:SsrA-binding protein
MNKKEEDKQYKEIVINKKAKFDFELLEFLEAGIVLTGSEVKSLRDKRANLTDAFARIKNGEIFLEGFNITPYKNGGYANHPEIRQRKLLLKKKEIMKLERMIKEKGLVVVAVRSYFNPKEFVKVQIALAKPKKLYDKRETIQTREAKIEIQRALKSRNR